MKFHKLRTISIDHLQPGMIFSVFEDGLHVLRCNRTEEIGTVDDYEGNNLYCVTVDEEFRSEGDDGYREVDEDQLEAVYYDI